MIERRAASVDSGRVNGDMQFCNLTQLKLCNNFQTLSIPFDASKKFTAKEEGEMSKSEMECDSVQSSKNGNIS